jgi:hypothetical protein
MYFALCFLQKTDKNNMLNTYTDIVNTHTEPTRCDK